MFNGSPRNVWLSSCPPGAQLLNFPQPPEPQRQRLVAVHFQSPPDRVLNLRSRRLGVNPDNEGGAGQPQNPDNGSPEARKFLRLCYLVGGLYSLIAVIQILTMSLLLPPDADLMLPGFVCIMTSLMSLFVLTILFRIRKIIWLSFILSIVFVEFVCVGVALVLIHRTPLSVGLSLLAASLLLVVCYVAGAWLPRIVLPGERVMIVLIIIFAVVSMVLITMHIFTNEHVYANAYFCLLLVMLIPTCIYHAQVVHSRRVRMPAYEYVLCGTYVYLHFLLFFCAFFFCIWVFKW